MTLTDSPKKNIAISESLRKPRAETFRTCLLRPGSTALGAWVSATLAATADYPIHQDKRIRNSHQKLDI